MSSLPLPYEATDNIEQYLKLRDIKADDEIMAWKRDPKKLYFCDWCYQNHYWGSKISKAHNKLIEKSYSHIPDYNKRNRK